MRVGRNALDGHVLLTETVLESFDNKLSLVGRRLSTKVGKELLHRGRDLLASGRSSNRSSSSLSLPAGKPASRQPGLEAGASDDRFSGRPRDRLGRSSILQPDRPGRYLCFGIEEDVADSLETGQISHVLGDYTLSLLSSAARRFSETLRSLLKATTFGSERCDQRTAARSFINIPPGSLTTCL